MLSVIIPTHNRAAQLQRGLAALAAQQYDLSSVEVLVVADSCSDTTAADVTALIDRVPFRLRLLSHSARSAAATRNLGAQHADGEWLLFLDDDIVAAPGLLAAHMADRTPQTITIGYSRPIAPQHAGQWQRDARRWWENRFREMAEPGYRFGYSDFFSGNISLAAALFRQVGGFDAAFQGRLEDYELGFRLIKAGAQMRFSYAAAGDHYDQTNQAQWLRRIRQEGEAHVLIGRRHPALRGELFAALDEPAKLPIRLLRRLALARPQGGRRLDQAMSLAAELAERLRLRFRRAQIIWALREYTYWRGVGSAIGGRTQLLAWLREAPPFDPQAAPQIAIQRLDSELSPDVLARASSAGLQLRIGNELFLAIRPTGGGEPLQAAHVHAVSARWLRNHAEQISDRMQMV